MANSFEMIMNACLESKKAVKNKKLAESKKSKKYVKEDDEVEVFDDELVDNDVPVEGDDEAEIMPDVNTDIMVVVDPETSEDDTPATDAQEIIDGTPEGEVPSTEEFIGDFTYTCPICGNTFFSAEELHAGDECPVCGETPDDFVLVGEVQPTDAQEDQEAEEEPAGEEEAPAEDEIADVDGDEDLEPDLDVVDDEETKEEGKCPKGAKCACEKKGYKIDESTFNPFMTKFIRENYRNARSFVITGAKLNKGNLTLECKITFNSGKTKKVNLTSRNFKSESKILACNEDGAFKCESTRVSPFVFKVNVKKGIISCEGMRYNLVTKAVKEGKRVQIYGNLSKKAKMESRKSK